MALAGLHPGGIRTPLDRAARLAQQPAAWVAFATGLLLTAYASGSTPSLSAWLGDTDDAVRLVTVRELLGGQSWFDTTLARIGAPEPLVSHWSRLVDAPLALLVLLLEPVLGPDAAELAMRAAWPVLLFIGLAAIVAQVARRAGGAWAMAGALGLAGSAGMAIAQFRPGRIDHHNAQILCAVGGLLLLAQGARAPRQGIYAGCLLGLGLAIGYEAIALVLPALALAGVIAVCLPRSNEGLVAALAAAAGTMLAALLVTTAPARLLEVHCDALSLNLVALAAAGAAGVWAATRLAAPLPVRLAIAGTAAATGLGLYAIADPRCLAGPFGQVDAALKPLWLDHVLETQSLFTFAGRQPVGAFVTALTLALGCAAAIGLARTARTAETVLLAAAVALAAVLGLWQIKLTPYAVWLAVVPIALWTAALPGTGTLSPAVTRLAALVLVSQTTLIALAEPVADVFGARSVNELPAAEREVEGNLQAACYRTQTVAWLGSLAAGLVAADIDLAPYIVATSDHRVVAAPYHRLGAGIQAQAEIFRGEPSRALQRARSLGVDYVATCSHIAAAPGATGLRASLLRGAAIPGVTEIDSGTGGSIRVWRIAR